MERMLHDAVALRPAPFRRGRTIASVVPLLAA